MCIRQKSVQGTVKKLNVRCSFVVRKSFLGTLACSLKAFHLHGITRCKSTNDILPALSADDRDQVLRFLFAHRGVDAAINAVRRLLRTILCTQTERCALGIQIRDAMVDKRVNKVRIACAIVGIRQGGSLSFQCRFVSAIRMDSKIVDDDAAALAVEQKLLIFQKGLQHAKIMHRDICSRFRVLCQGIGPYAVIHRIGSIRRDRHMPRTTIHLLCKLL